MPFICTVTIALAFFLTSVPFYEHKTIDASIHLLRQVLMEEMFVSPETLPSTIHLEVYVLEDDGEVSLSHAIPGGSK